MATSLSAGKSATPESVNGNEQLDDQSGQYSLRSRQETGGGDTAAGQNDTMDDEDIGLDASFPEPVGTLEDEEKQNGKKSKKSAQNFNLKCVWEDVSEDENTATVYHFKINLTNKKVKNKDKEPIVYDVEISQDDFGGAYKKWTKQIKDGLLFCPGGQWAFAEKIQLAILEYQARETDDEEEGLEYNNKEKLRIDKETVVKINGTTYFISGRKNIFILSPKDTPYSRKLTPDEIEELPVKVVFTGKEVNYEDNPTEATKELLELLRHFNSNQLPHNQTSFVYGILQNLKAELFLVIDDHRVIVIYSKTTNSGKTVLMQVGDILSKGVSSGLSAGCTEAGIRNRLGAGLVGRFDEIDLKDISNVTKLQKAIWQPGGGLILMGNDTIKIQSNCIITTNLYPHEAQKAWKLTHADLTKYDYNHIGESPMEIVNDEFQEELDECIEIATRLHKHKPFLLGLAFSVVHKRPTGRDISKYEEMVGVKSVRFTQGIVQLDNFCENLVGLARDCFVPEDDIPNSVLNPTFGCILKAKNLVALQSERRPMDLISEIIKDVEEARKCLVVTKMGRKGIAVWTPRLKDSRIYKDWMNEVALKLDNWDSVVDGNRVRGKLVKAEDLDDLYDTVVELLTITVERSLIGKFRDHLKKVRIAQAHLKEDIMKYCVVVRDDVQSQEEESQEEESQERRAMKGKIQETTSSKGLKRKRQTVASSFTLGLESMGGVSEGNGGKPEDGGDGDKPEEGGDGSTPEEEGDGSTPKDGGKTKKAKKRAARKVKVGGKPGEDLLFSASDDDHADLMEIEELDKVLGNSPQNSDEKESSKPTFEDFMLLSDGKYQCKVCPTGKTKYTARKWAENHILNKHQKAN